MNGAMYEKTFWESFLKIFWGLYRDSVGLQPPKMGWYILRVYSSFDYWKMGFDCQLYHLLAHWAQVTFLLSLNLNCLIRKRTIKCLTALLERLSITPKSTYLLCLLHGLKLSSVQSLSHVWLFETPWTAACQASLSITNSQSLFKLMSIESVMPSHHLILCHPLLLLPSIFPSIRVFSDESALHIRWPKYWSFSFNISPSNEHPGLISFRMD